MHIRIVTDSAADFSQDELRRLCVTCVPMEITFGQDTFTDGLTLTQEIFWQRLTGGENPKTSQPSPDAFLRVFEEAKAAGDAVVCVLLSSALSGTIQSAVIAKSMIDYEPIYIVDSLLAAVAEKVLVMHACRLRDEGSFSAGELAQALEAFRARICLFACLDTLEYLARGGRIPQAAANIGSLVQLKPLITLSTDGRVEMAGKAIGRHRALSAMLKLACDHPADPAYPILPLYSYKPDNCFVFADRLRQAGIPCLDEDAAAIGATIATHIGPNAYGIVFVKPE